MGEIAVINQGRNKKPELLKSKLHENVWLWVAETKDHKLSETINNTVLTFKG